jgi:predicted cupin superfamily sugar epimerase
MITPQQLIEQYQMLSHPEGGYYKETYKSQETIAQNALPERFSGARSFSTAIYFLLQKGDFSAFHKIQSDECWHFYAGETLNIYVLHKNGELQIIKLGNNIEAGEAFQYAVPAGCWFASEPAKESDFSFVGCTVAPGFDFNDFVLANADELLIEYPQHEGIIKLLCR